MADHQANTLSILFFGDLVGKPGRKIAEVFLKGLQHKPDVVIANVENATHGFGFSQSHYDELQEAGVNVFTGGNHIWDRKEIFDYIHEAHYLVRPHNYPNHLPGLGSKIFQFSGVKVGVINLMGQVFMPNCNSPWESLEVAVQELLVETPIIFLDFHAEATAEKICLAHHAANIGVKAMTGTHTHVQTADERIINGTMGFITDTGFNGTYDSVIGMDKGVSLKRLKDQLPARMDVAESDILQLNAILYQLDKVSGQCLGVERINRLFSIAENDWIEKDALKSIAK